MDLFTLKIQVAGAEHEVSADRHGQAIVVATADGSHLVRSVHAATRTAASALGPLLEQAHRNSAPWGLYVDVSGKQAVYGDWPLLPGSPAEFRPRPTQLSKIRALWREGDGPIAALDNAIKIIEEFAHPRRLAA